MAHAEVRSWEEADEILQMEICHQNNKLSRSTGKVPAKVWHDAMSFRGGSMHPCPPPFPACIQEGQQRPHRRLPRVQLRDFRHQTQTLLHRTPSQHQILGPRAPSKRRLALCFRGFQPVAICAILLRRRQVTRKILQFSKGRVIKFNCSIAVLPAGIKKLERSVLSDLHMKSNVLHLQSEGCLGQLAHGCHSLRLSSNPRSRRSQDPFPFGGGTLRARGQLHRTARLERLWPRASPQKALFALRRAERSCARHRQHGYGLRRKSTIISLPPFPCADFRKTKGGSRYTL